MSRSLHLRNCTALLAVLASACATPPAPEQSAQPPTSAPPPAAAMQSGLLVNPGFESTAPGRRANDPEGWFTHQHAGDPAYRFEVDATERHRGLRSMRIDNLRPQAYGAVTQALEAAPHAGKVARLSAWMKTRGVDGQGAALTLMTLQSGSAIANNFMADAPIKGSVGWTRYTITLPVARTAERLEVGAMLMGNGSLWLDDVELEFVTP